MTEHGVTLLPHDHSWARAFDDERLLLLGVAGELLTAVEHVGSTSIPGIVAKPTIDIAATVRSFDITARLVKALARAGYDYVGEYEDELPQRRYFRKGERAPERTHHLHVYEEGHPDFEDYLLFRDWLRSHPGDARAYETLKKELAVTAARARYSYDKADFVHGIVERARADR